MQISFEPIHAGAPLMSLEVRRPELPLPTEDLRLAVGSTGTRNGLIDDRVGRAAGQGLDLAAGYEALGPVLWLLVHDQLERIRHWISPLSGVAETASCCIIRTTHVVLQIQHCQPPGGEG